MLNWLFWISALIFISVVLIGTGTGEGVVIGCVVAAIAALVVFLGLVSALS